MSNIALDSHNFYGSTKYFQIVVRAIGERIKDNAKNVIGLSLKRKSNRYIIENSVSGKPQFEILWTLPRPHKKVQYYQKSLSCLKITLVPQVTITRDFRLLYREICDYIRTSSLIFSLEEEVRLEHYTSQLSRLIPSKYTEKTLENTLLIIREHSLISVFNLLKLLEQYGLQPKNTVFYSKGDNSLNRERVDESLKSRGYSVNTFNSFQTVSRTGKTRDIRVLPEITTRIKKELKPMFDRAKKENKKLILFDDGGLLITTVVAEFRNDLSALTGIIETTKAGMHAIEAKKGFPLTVVNLANSLIKNAMSPVIAQSVVYNVRNMLPHIGFIGTAAIVVGYGAIGREVAYLLKALHVKVYVCEIEVDKMREAKKDGFPVTNNAKRLFQTAKPKIVMGCTGLDALTYQNLIVLPDDTYIATVSSNEIKQSYKHMDKHCSLRLIPDYGREYTLPSGNKITILADGHSVNLFHEEGALHADYQPYLASMCATIMYVATNKLEPHRGLDTKLANYIETEARILTAFEKILKA